jgi:hypothetical protein
MMAEDTFTEFHLSRSNSQGVATNAEYPHYCKINNLKTFKKATDFDHTIGKFVDDHRTKKNFISADCIFLDVDNDSKLQPEDWNDSKQWMTIARFHKEFEGVEHIITPSKSHQKIKGNRKSRDRFHIYFPLDHQLTSVEEYEEHIELLVKLFTRLDGVAWFDTNAVDCARFFYGREKGISISPEHKKGISVLDWMAKHPLKDEIHTQLITSSPGTKSIAVKSGDQSRKLLYLSSWKFKKLVKGRPKELFYGEVEVESETDRYWKVRCTSGKHEDNEASLQIDKETLGWFCWAENKGGNCFDFMSHRDNEEEGKIVDRFCEAFEVERTSRGSLYMDGVVIEEDDLTPEDEAVERLNKKHALITIGGKVRVMQWGKKKQWMTGNRMVVYPDLDFLSVQDFGHYYTNDNLSVIGKPHPVNVARIWMEHRNRKHYEGIEFDPSNNTLPKQGEAWNMWFDWWTQESGYMRFLDKKKYSEIKNEKQALAMCFTYMQHIQKNICGDFVGEQNNKAFQYILYWMADCLVNPTRRRTCIALKGGQGVGKGQFVGKFSELFGNHFTHLTNSDHMTDQFNWHLKDNLLLFADEAFFAGDRKQANAMKGLITEPMRQLRKLYADAVSVPNFTSVIMASNDDWMIQSDIDDRRFFIMDVKNNWQRDKAQFTKMNDEWNSGGKEAFAYFLTEVIAKRNDFDTYDFENEKIVTKTHWDQIFNSNPLIDWYVRVIDNGYFTYKDEDGKVAKLEFEEHKTNYFRNTEAIWRDYTEYMNAQGRSGHKFAKNRFSRLLKDLPITFSNDKSLRKDRAPDENGKVGKDTVWMFGSLDVLRSEWEKLTSSTQWSGRKFIANEHAGVLEQLTGETEEEDTTDVLGRQKKMIRDFSKIIVNE